MAKRVKNEGETKVHGTIGNEVFEILKALIIALVMTLALVLTFALIMKWVSVPDAAIAPVNQVIKGLSLLVSELLAIRDGKGGWRKGLITGLCYVLFAFVIFSALDGRFQADITLLYDTLLGGVMGMISGVIAVNVRKPKTAV